MSDERPYWPANPRPFVVYRPPLPTHQPTRSESAREAWADARRFLDRVAEPYPSEGDALMITAHRWSAESMRGQSESWLGEWPAECSVADFDEAVRLANDCFGQPRHRSSKAHLKQNGLEEEQVWPLPVARIDEVLDFLERVPTCTGGEWAPVHASYPCMFRLRDLETGAVLPDQGELHHPMKSWLRVTLQRRSSATLTPLILPFAEPDNATADYVVALQAHAPLWFDPRYFDHMTLSPDGSRYHRLRLPPDWVGLTPDGAPRLDASRSGIIPMEVDLPTEAEMAAEDPERYDAPFQTNYAAVATALREHSLATLLIRGADDAKYMVERAAAWLAMPLHVIRTLREPKPPSIEEELRTMVSGLDGRRTVLLLEIEPYPSAAETNAALLSQMAGRVLLGVELPPEVRLVVSVYTEPREAAQAADSRWHAAGIEGFGTRQQLEYLERQASRAGWREVVIEVLPIPQGSS